MSLPLKFFALTGLLMILQAQLAIQSLSKEDLDEAIENTPLLLICFHSGKDRIMPYI